MCVCVCACVRACACRSVGYGETVCDDMLVALFVGAYIAYMHA